MGVDLEILIASGAKRISLAVDIGMFYATNRICFEREPRTLLFARMLEIPSHLLPVKVYLCGETLE